jgi:aspartate aminotransferase-like enzyme
VGRDGLTAFQDTHVSVARYARDRARGLGLGLMVANPSDASPTVTALRLPDGLAAADCAARLAHAGVAVDAGRGPNGAEVLRIGHLGSQADLAAVKRCLDAVSEILPVPVREAP